MKLATFRRIVLLISVIVLGLPVTSPAAELVSASAAPAGAPAPMPVPAQEILTPSLTQASIEEETAVPAGSAASQSSVRRHKKNKGLSLSQLLRKYPETLKTQVPAVK
ncbi:hypothetical protein [Paenibacillus rhizoplanae]|uniref:hypothetical protein n=1 Tax=Paenibacillus rhizoplanae TaxID=1917181 RepID=UPI00361D1196